MAHRSSPCARRVWLQGSVSLVTGTLFGGCLGRGAEGEVARVKPVSDPQAPIIYTTTAAATALSTARTQDTLTPVGEATIGDGPASALSSSSLKTIYLQPFGDDLTEADLTYVEAALRLYFPFSIRRLPTKPLPKQAYYALRHRYRAERLLTDLEQHTPTDAQVMVGLTEADISTTKEAVYDWGVLGLATLSGQQCVISRFRAKRGATSETQVQVRLAKTVVHEVGHTIGLPHCPNYGCIMEDGKGTVTTTDHERDVCSACRSRVGELMLPVPTELPW